jgi:hypothetical protein
VRCWIQRRIGLQLMAEDDVSLRLAGAAAFALAHCRKWDAEWDEELLPLRWRRRLSTAGRCSKIAKQPQFWIPTMHSFKAAWPLL